MKNILINLDSGVVCYYDYDFTLRETCVEARGSVSGQLEFVIADLNSSNSYVAQVEHITDFTGGKYIYDDGALLLNPDYTPIPEA